ncbi:hypothetical protein ACRALDRAFT_1081707 [Sodiomyces alcalophilus JCM 7366]|uniref:uncharacterized protein n=1 Tax=Sodiomyces alcalophilus JCM 7366 TaxID=591952 RepID=UPI0039B59261
MTPRTLARIASDSTHLSQSSILIPPKIEPPDIVYLPAIATMSLGAPGVHALPKKLSAAAFHGFRAVELYWDDLLHFAQATTGGVSPDDLRRAAAAIRTRCIDLGLRVLSLQPFRDFDLLTDRAARHDRLEEFQVWLDVATILDTDVIVVPASSQLGGDLARNNTTGRRGGAGMNNVMYTRLAVRNLRILADAARARTDRALGSPVRIAFKNRCFARHAQSWADALTVVELCDRPNVLFLPDTFHITAADWADSCSSSILSDAARLVADDPVVAAAAARGEPPRLGWARKRRLFPFEGYLPIDQALWALTSEPDEVVGGPAVGYKGFISMEVFSEDGDEVDEDLVDRLAFRARKAWETTVVKMGWAGRADVVHPVAKGQLGIALRQLRREQELAERARQVVVAELQRRGVIDVDEQFVESFSSRVWSCRHDVAIADPVEERHAQEAVRLRAREEMAKRTLANCERTFEPQNGEYLGQIGAGDSSCDEALSSEGERGVGRKADDERTKKKWKGMKMAAAAQAMEPVLRARYEASVQAAREKARSKRDKQKGPNRFNQGNDQKQTGEPQWTDMVSMPGSPVDPDVARAYDEAATRDVLKRALGRRIAAGSGFYGLRWEGIQERTRQLAAAVAVPRHEDARFPPLGVEASLASSESTDLFDMHLLFQTVEESPESSGSDGSSTCSSSAMDTGGSSGSEGGEVPSDSFAEDAPLLPNAQVAGSNAP